MNEPKLIHHLLPDISLFLRPVVKHHPTISGKHRPHIGGKHLPTTDGKHLPTTGGKHAGGI
jgi:hypothetical protein